MKKIELAEMKELELGILDAIDKFCKKNNLSFQLAGGTLLGAVRHKGFIPWDDDIDLRMYRDDYEYLLAHFNEQNDRYKVLSYKNTKGYYYPFAKVVDTKTVLKETMLKKIPEMGVFVDIFQMDNISDDIKERKKIFEKKRLCEILVNITSGRMKTAKSRSSLKKNLKKIIYPIGKIIPTSYPARKQDELCLKYNNRKTKDIFCVTGQYGMGEVVPRDSTLRTVELTFEGRRYPVPENYDLYLRGLYGDYMKLPPKEKRIAPHITKCYWRENGE